MQRTYLFYDIETSGLNKCFDQVLQFAAIRTDLNGNELEQHEILIKLSPDTVPAPQAFLSHQIPLAALERGVPEYEAMCQIHQLLNHPGTISVGYNSLNFDDEFLRFSFYRNLLTPYTHQYANNCGRMDIYPMTVMYYLFKPGVINWQQIDNVNTFRLEHLSKANQLAEGRAHDALTDVKATLALARALMQETEMWNYLCGYFDKKLDLERTQKLQVTLALQGENYRQALLVDGSFGANNNYQCMALGLGMHNHYKNQSLWLKLDDPKLRETAVDTIDKTTFILRKRFGEPPLLLPKVPRFVEHYTPERLEIAASNLAWLGQNPQLMRAIVNYHKDYRYPYIPNLDVDAALYQDGFLSDRDQEFCAHFHALDLPGKILMLENFPKQKLRIQAMRVLGRNYLESLPKALQEEFTLHLRRINTDDPAQIYVDYRNEKRLTAKRACEAIKLLLQDEKLQLEQRNILQELEKYLNYI